MINDLSIYTRIHFKNIEENNEEEKSMTQKTNIQQRIDQSLFEAGSSKRWMQGQALGMTQEGEER